MTGIVLALLSLLFLGGAIVLILGPALITWLRSSGERRIIEMAEAVVPGAPENERTISSVLEQLSVTAYLRDPKYAQQVDALFATQAPHKTAVPGGSVAEKAAGRMGESLQKSGVAVNVTETDSDGVLVRAAQRLPNSVTIREQKIKRQRKAEVAQEAHPAVAPNAGVEAPPR